MKKSQRFSLLSHTLIALTVVSFSFHTMFCSPLSSHYGNTFFSFLHFTTWNKASQFFLDLCILQKLCRENSNLVVSILGVTPKQKSHFSLLVSCPILLFFSSFHKRGPLGQNHQNSLQNCLFIRLQIKFFDTQGMHYFFDME